MTEALAGTTDTLLTSASDAGRVGMTINMIFAVLLGLALVAGGVYVASMPMPETVQVDAIVIEVVSCKMQENNRQACEAKVKYEGEEKIEMSEGITYFFSRNVNVGERVKMEYPVGNPMAPSECCASSNLFMGSLLFFGGVLTLLTAVYLSWARKNQALTTGYGAGMTAGMVKRAWQAW